MRQVLFTFVVGRSSLVVKGLKITSLFDER